MARTVKADTAGTGGAPQRSSSAKATPAKAAPAKAAPAKATPAKATPAKATPAKATPAKATPAKARPAKAGDAKPAADPAGRSTTPGKKQAAKAAPAGKPGTAKAAPAKKTAPAATTTAQKGATTRATTPKAATRAATPHGTTRAAATPKASATRTSTSRRSPASARPTATKHSLLVRDDETPWTATELREVRSSIEADVEQLRGEIQLAEEDLVVLMRDGGDGAGDDQADAGAKTFEREQEIQLANNAREMLLQNLHALERLADGTYGTCEACGNAIGKLRLQAAPRATLCVPCKTKQERR